MNKIEEYRRRKRDRLVDRMRKADSVDEKARLAIVIYRKFFKQSNMDDDEPDWITISGTHTPLKDGKAIGGGKLTGRDFSQAKSVKYQKKPKGSKGVKGNVPYAPKVPPNPPNINKFKNMENYHKKVEEYNAAVDAYNDEYNAWLESQMPDHAMTEDEITEWGNKYGMYISDDVYEHVDGKVMTTFTNRFDQLASDFPEVLNLEMPAKYGPLTYTPDLHADEKGNDSYIMAHGTYSGFHFGDCASDYDDFASSVYYNQATGFTVATSQGVNSVIDHEFGHRVFDYMCTKVANNNDQLTEFANDFAHATYKAKGQSTDCSKNQKELFAEGFTAYYDGETTEFATNMGTFINKWMDKLRD